MTILFKTIVTMLAVMCALCMNATAQTSELSTPSTTSQAALSNAQQQVDQEAESVKHETEALRLELRIRRLIDEVKTGRVLITSQLQELGTADVQLEKEKEKSASLEKSRKLLADEVEHLMKATDNLLGVVELKSQAIAVLEKRNDELKRSASKNRKRAFWATAAAALLGGLLVLK